MADAGTRPGRELQRVVAAVVRRGSTFLICQRPPHKRHGGLWEFPGGKCEPGESDTAAVRRELDEELGLTVHEVRDELYAHRDPGSPFLIVFLEASTSGEPQCREHAATRWATAEDLQAMPLAPTDARFVREVIASHAR